MIIPSGFSLRTVKTTIFTYALIALNVFIFCVFFVDADDYQQNELTDADLRNAGRIYAQTYAPSWLAGADMNSPEMLSFLGGLAVRTRGFDSVMSASPATPHDEAGAFLLREHLHTFREKLEERPLYRFGLNRDQQNSMAWITYQFAHANWMHLLTNMFFLFIFGVMVEQAVGGLAVLAVYVLGGIAGGALFVAMNSDMIAPMVGASAAVSALIAFYPMVERRKNIRSFFIFLHLAKNTPFIYVPVWSLFLLFVVSDFASLLSSPSGFVSAVAYPAHVGGAIFGLIAGYLCRFLRRPERIAFEIEEP